MKTDSLRFRVLAPLAVALAVLLAAFVAAAYWSKHRVIANNLTRDLRSAQDLFEGDLEEHGHMMSALIEIITRNGPLQDAFRRQDREALVHLATPMYEQLHSEHDITHFYFRDANRVTLARVHRPDRYGDRTNYFTTLEAERTGKLSYGIELGTFGTFTLRVVKPWHDGQRLLGYVELGMEIGEIVQEIRHLLDVQVYFVIDKRFLDREQWEAGMMMLGREAHWDQFPSVVVVDQTLDVIPEDLAQLLAHGDYERVADQHRETRVGGRRYGAGYFPVKDATGQSVGHMAVLRDVTTQVTAARTTVLLVGAVCVAVGAGLFVIFYVILGRVERELADARRRRLEESGAREAAQDRHIREVQREREALRRSESDLKARLDELAKARTAALNMMEDAETARRETQRAEAALRMTQFAVDHAGDAIFWIDADARFFKVNDAACRQLGYGREELLEMSVYDIDPEYPQDKWPEHWEAFRSRRSGTIETHHRAKDGRVFPVEVAVNFMEFDGREFICALARDATERKQAEAERRRLVSGIESAGEAIVMTDPDGTIRYVNPAFTRLTGYTAEEAIGRTPRVLKSGRHAPEFYTQMWETILRGGTWAGEVVNRRKDGTLYDASLTIAPVLDGKGEPEGFLAVQSDITQRKRAETTLRQAKESAEAANRAKSHFLANMSHEIRTPMTAILGFAENLLDPDMPKSEQLNLLDRIHRNGQHLLQIINDILDFSKIEAGKFEAESIECSPCQIVSEVSSLLRPRATSKGLTFDVEYRGPMPETIRTDPTRLRQVLINLLGNAVKFTETGGVRLVVGFVEAEGAEGSDQDPSEPGGPPPGRRRDSHSADTGSGTTRLASSPHAGSLESSSVDTGPTRPGSVESSNPQDVESRLQFDVVDTGIGMTNDQAKRVFGSFTQADASMRRRFGGTGLGLAISKRLADILGGDITVESRIGRGSTFRLTVAMGPLDGVRMLDKPEEAIIDAPPDTPAATGLAPDGAAPASGRGRETEPLDCRVLLAEDGPDNQRLISFILHKAGADVTVVGNGQQAVDVALGSMLCRRHGDTARPFDVILMDMQMPVMDGYTAVRALRENGYDRPIIALTAHALASERKKCVDAGCDDYATKPIDRTRLIEMIRQQLKEANERAAARRKQGRDGAAGEGPDVLLSELADDPDLTGFLEMFGADLPDRLSEMAEALDNHEYETVALLAHRLKGAGGSYGFPSIAEAAAKLEAAGGSERRLEKLAEQFKELAELCGRARARPIRSRT